MSRMNARNRKKNYKNLVERDGEVCFICRKSCRKVKLVIDHWDNDNANDDPSNLHLVCQPDNIKKNPRGKGKKMSPVCVSEWDEERIFSAEFKKNREDEPKFRHWLYQKLKLNNQISYDEVINGGAEYVGSSQESIKRYLKKLCSKEGLMNLMQDEEGKKYVVLKNMKELLQRTAAIEFQKDKMQQERKLLLIPSTKDCTINISSPDTNKINSIG